MGSVASGMEATKERVYRGSGLIDRNGVPHWYVDHGVRTGLVHGGKELIDVHGALQMDCGTWRTTQDAARQDCLRLLTAARVEFLAGFEKRMRESVQQVMDSAS
jgi:hypothetical protein